LIKPKVILLLGKDAAGAMLNLDAKQTLSAMQGRLYEYAKDIYAIPTYHPSYLLRTGGEKSPKFKDVLKHFEYAKELISKTT
ncbi:MAG TPA: uracil-DNA glycosylase family protein, partial [Patescibacteria group bacterium]|nr:uracil-DNA glycosylase family protein [Patescibacteria group bacterium]